jgi:hypothetical protein
MNRKAITIIKYGPPASGKGSEFVKNKIKEILKTEQNIPTQTNLTTFKKSYTNSLNITRQLVNINMNKPVESNPKYVESTQQMKQYIKNKFRVTDNSTDYLNKLRIKNTAEMYRLYGKYAKPLYNLSNKEIEEANANSADVIIETTGQRGLPNWLKIREYREYHIIFPIISFETLWKRYKNRANKGEAFRILSTKEQLRKVYLDSYYFFLKYYLKNAGYKVYVLDNEGNVVKFLNKNASEQRIKDLIEEAESNKRNKSNN